MFYLFPTLDMTGADLGATALTNAQTGAQEVIDVLTETVGNNIQFILLVATVLAAIGLMRWVVGRFSRLHRG